MSYSSNFLSLDQAYLPRIGELNDGFLADNYNPYFQQGCGYCVKGSTWVPNYFLGTPSLPYVNVVAGVIKKNEKKSRS